MDAISEKPSLTDESQDVSLWNDPDLVQSRIRHGWQRMKMQRSVREPVRNREARQFCIMWR